MGRRKVVLELISNGSSRASTFKKRRASIIKKAEELSKLCGIDVCVVSEVVRSKKQSGQVGKMQHQLQKIERETDNILKDISDGSGIGDTASSDSAANLSALVERLLKEMQDRIYFLNSAPVQHHPATLDVGYAAGSREAMLPAHVVWSSPEYGMEPGSIYELIGATAGTFPAECTVEVGMPGLVDTIDMEKDPVMESVGADRTNLVNLPLVLPSEEEMSGLLDESTGSDWISNGVPFMEWDDVMKDWTLKEAMLPTHVDVVWPSTEYGTERGSTFGSIRADASSFPAGCTAEVGMPGLLKQDPVMESVGADGLNLVNLQGALTSEEEMPGFPTKTDWISSSGPFPEWDDVVKDWM
ncbi:Transcription factor RLM1 [Carex littledalei]|uniref:Transcription factor RLM1 n=1 Tax=Carex littledalei TaxID=544730 RepID=A0A833VYA8_9POAL|nr:Transcription factor RLM1 [Carex littledalei]